MSKDYQITLQTNEAQELLNIIRVHIANQPEDPSWNEIYVLNGLLAGVIHRHQMLLEAAVPLGVGESEEE